MQSAKAAAAADATAGNGNQDTISEAKNKLKKCEETTAKQKYSQIILHAKTCVENETKKYIPEAIGSDGELKTDLGNNENGDKDEKGDYASGSIKGVCMKAQEKAQTCCFNPEKCPYEHTRIARQVLQVAAPLAAAFATQIGSIKAATGKWDPYKYCQFNNIKGLMETGSATTVNMLSLMKKGCGAGEKSCVKECGGEIKDFKEDLEACFDPIAEFLGRKKGLSISEIKALLEKGFEDQTEDPLLAYKIQLWSSQANSSPAAELKDAVNKKANDAYYGISKSPGGKNLRNGAESSDIVDCGESNRKFSHMQNTGDPALLKPFMMSFCQKVGEQTPPRKIASPLRPSLLGSPQGGADTSAAFTGSDSSPGNFKSSFPGGPGAAPAVSDDDLPLGGDDKNPGPLVGSGLTYPGGSPGGSGSGPGGGFAGSDSGGEDEEGEEEDYPGEGFGSNDGYGFQPPEAWEGGAFAGGDSYGGGLAMDGPGGGDGSGFGRRKEKDSKDGGSPDLKKYLPDNLDPDMSIFQIMSDRIQEFCRENIREGCF